MISNKEKKSKSKENVSPFSGLYRKSCIKLKWNEMESEVLCFFPALLQTCLWFRSRSKYEKKNSKIHVFGTIRMYVFYLIQNIKYWKCPAISKKIVPCFMYPVFIELYSSANKLFFSLLFCRSSLLLALWFTFHLFVLVFDFSAQQNVPKMCIWALFSFPVQLLRVLHDALATSIFDLHGHWDGDRDHHHIYSNHILFVCLFVRWFQNETCKTVNRISIHKFSSLCTGFAHVLIVDTVHTTHLVL